ncbi:hypothetical protein TNCV_3410831 [Trichonephila clavipes]|nr:hypothetical protein TNCV_3410831 [Trichonephila clavipes]
MVKNLDHVRKMSEELGSAMVSSHIVLRSDLNIAEWLRNWCLSLICAYRQNTKNSVFPARRGILIISNLHTLRI